MTVDLPSHPARDALDVPVIDVSALYDGDRAARLAVGQQIDGACRGCGFFFAVNHGADLDALQDRTSRFHKALSDEEKFRLAIRAYNPSSPRSRSGYYMAIAEKKANESFCYLSPMFDEEHPRIRAKAPLHEVNVWPDESRTGAWRAFYEDYYRQVFGVSKALLRGLALGLGKAEDFFERHFEMETTLSAVSLIRYPYLEVYPPVKTGKDGTKLSFEDHQDVSLITVLYQTPVPNLQVRTVDGYRYLPTLKDGFLVNCGTYMSYLTRDQYFAPIHRVAFVNAERLSIPFFVHFGFDDAVEPFPPRPDEPERGEPLRYGDYLGKALGELIVSNGQT